MFENLSEKLQRTFKNLRGQGTLTPEHLDDGLREIRLALLEADVNFKVVKQLLAGIRKKALGQEVLTALSPAAQVLKIVRDDLVTLLGTRRTKLRHGSIPPSVYFLVGLQGSGKTTTTGKLALWLSKQGRKPLMVSVDVHRPAARQQLEIVGGQINLPVYSGAETESTPAELALGALREARQIGRDIVLVDTAGRQHVDNELMEELEQLRDRLEPAELLFVADAMTGQDAVKSATEFHQRLALTGVVLTKMDGDARGGAALSIRQVTGCPIKFLGVGEKPSAFEVFHPDRIVSRLLGMGDMMTLIEKVEERVDQKEALAMQRRMLRNQFTLEDFRKQLHQVKRMGSLRSIVEMLPATGPFRQLQGADLDTSQFVRIEAVINSMTAKERADDSILNGSRRRRIASGSGTTVQTVNQVLKQFRQARNMMKGLGPTKGRMRRRKRRRKGKRRRGPRALGPGPGSMGPGGMDIGRLLGR